MNLLAQILSIRAILLPLCANFVIKSITRPSQVDKRPALGFPRLRTAKDKQHAKRDPSRVRQLPKAGKPITKAW